MIEHEKRWILYVDDTVEQRYAMRRILESEGFRVLEAGSGKEALAPSEHPLALAVVDVRLPDINGYQLSRQLKARHHNLPVLQISASFSDPDLRAAGLSGGADAYIAQPVHPGELTSLIRRMLRTAAAEASLRFLAAIGPAFAASLSLDETVHNIRQAICPTFADECAIHLQTPGRPTTAAADQPFEVPHVASEELALSPADSRMLVAPLLAGGMRLGTIGFRLQPAREYNASDLPMAADLASRAALALHNCVLFASEQSTRTALIQAEKLATAGRMSAAIAHEINNPLAALTNLIYILERSDESTPFIRETATAALAEVQRLAHITRQSLGFYRELRAPEMLNLSESVLETLALNRKRADSAGITLSTGLREGILLHGVKGEIRQVISNLLVNAIEAMPRGGSIHLSTVVVDDKALLRIQDRGPGVDPSMRDAIFEPFFTTKQGTGTGLGLWVTRSIVEKHGGAIQLEAPREHDTGATFVVTFPLCSDTAAQI